MKKLLEKKLLITNNNNPDYFTFGKCFLEQTEKHGNFLNDFIFPFYKDINLHFEHCVRCPLSGLYKDKTDAELEDINKHFNDLRITRNKRIALASVGVILDHKVNQRFFSYNFLE